MKKQNKKKPYVVRLTRTKMLEKLRLVAFKNNIATRELIDQAIEEFMKKKRNKI